MNLIAKARELKKLARNVQDEKLTDEQRKELLDELSEYYAGWYAEAKKTLGGNLKIELAKPYNGTVLVPGIRAFLQRGWMLYQYYQEGNPLTPRWVVDVERGFVNRIDEQVNIIAGFL